MVRTLLVASTLLVTLAVTASEAQAPKITVTNVGQIVGPDFLGDKPVKFAPAAQVSNVGILAGQVKKIRLHTHEFEDHVVYVVKGRALARLGDERREVGPGGPDRHPEARPALVRSAGRRAVRDPRQLHAGLGSAEGHPLPGVSAVHRLLPRTVDDDPGLGGDAPGTAHRLGAA